MPSPLGIVMLPQRNLGGQCASNNPGCSTAVVCAHGVGVTRVRLSAARMKVDQS